MVRDRRILNAMARRGFIVYDGRAKDRHWTGATVKRLWVGEGPALKDWYEVFTYHGRDYRLRYVDGCFYPFVFEIGATGPAFV